MRALQTWSPDGPGTAAFLAATFAACLALPSGAFARGAATVAVRGTVTDETGASLPGYVVRLLKARTIVDLGDRGRREQSVEEARGTTDAQGFFEFEFTADPQFRSYYLRYYDPAGFDGVKYLLPEDRDVSRRVRQGRAVQGDVVLRLQPGWPKVAALIDQYGAGSHCGQVLRALGLPDRRVPQENGGELWEYEAAGVTYLVEGSKIRETRRAARPSAPGPEATRPPEDAVVPAERVEEP